LFSLFFILFVCLALTHNDTGSTNCNSRWEEHISLSRVVLCGRSHSTTGWPRKVNPPYILNTQ